MTHITQLDNEFTNDCGPATIAQGVYLLTGILLTIAQIVAWLGNRNKFTTIAQMIAAFKHYGVVASYEANATWEWYARKLDEGCLIFALVAYDQFSDNPLGYIYAHFMTVLAYDATHVIVHDPLRRNGPLRIPRAEFVRAINTPSRYVGGFNRPNQAIVAETRRTAPDPRALLTVVRTGFVGIREMAKGA